MQHVHEMYKDQMGVKMNEDEAFTLDEYQDFQVNEVRKQQTIYCFIICVLLFVIMMFDLLLIIVETLPWLGGTIIYFALSAALFLEVYKHNHLSA